MTFWYLFNSIWRQVNNINIIPKYLLLEVVKKNLDKKKSLLNYFNRF